MGKIIAGKLIFRTLALILLITCATVAAFAATVPAFKIDPTKSTLSFTAIQNDSPINGQFGTFTADILFSQQFLADSMAIITIDLASINSSYGEVSKTLQLPLWFDTATYPKAIFHSTAFRWKGGKQFEVDGTLAIRDKTVPVTLEFTLKEFTTDKTVVEGKTTLKRTAFGVGQGEWMQTNVVKDDVVVSFHIEAKPENLAQKNK